MIEAQGGVRAWAAPRSVRFTERRGDGPATAVTVEQGARRVFDDTASGMTATMTSGPGTGDGRERREPARSRAAADVSDESLRET